MKKKDLKKKNKKKTKGDDDSSGSSSSSSSDSSSSSSSSSDDDTPSNAPPSEKHQVIYDVNYDYLGLKRQKFLRNEQQNRLFKLKRRAVNLAVTSMISWLVYTCLWLPFIIVSFLWTFQPDIISDEVHVAVAVLTFVGVAIKPIVYLTNGSLRACIREALYGPEKTANE